MSELDDAKLRHLLKKSPTLTPPESFYRGVLDKIEKKPLVADDRAPWYWGYPAKALASVCVLLLIVMVSRETRQISMAPPLKEIDSRQVMSEESKPALPRAESDTFSHDLSSLPAVQDRLRKKVDQYVDHPSPFEEEDEKLKAELRADNAPKGLQSGVRAKDINVGVPTAASMPKLKQQITNNGQANESLLESMQPMNVGGAQKKADFGFHAGASLASGGAGQTRESATSRAVSFDSPLEPGLEWKGTTSGVMEFRTVSIHSPAEWNSLWREHTQLPQPEAPAVDFIHFLVVGVFAGSYPEVESLTIDRIETATDHLTIYYHEVPLHPGVRRASSLNRPYHLRVIPKTNLPIQFSKNS